MPATSPYLNRPTLSERERKLVDALQETHHDIAGPGGAHMPDLSPTVRRRLAKNLSLLAELGQ